MKKIFVFLLSIFLCFVAKAQETSYVDEEEVRPVVTQQNYLYCGSNDDPIRVVSFMNYPPFGWKETQMSQENDVIISKYYGVGMELFKRFAKEKNLRFVFVNALNFKEAKYALATGYFDVLVTDFYDPKAYRNIANFHPGYISNPIVIVTLKSNLEQPKKLSDLIGKTGYVRKEENFYDLFKSSIPEGVKIKQISGPKKAFYDLLKKKIDFILMSKYAYETEARRFKISDYMTYSDPIFSPYVFMSYAKNNLCAHFIKDALEKSLKEYTTEEKYIQSTLVRQLDIWEKKFKDQPSLLFETGDPEEETEEKTDDLKAWLEAQQQKKEDKSSQKKSSVGM